MTVRTGEYEIRKYREADRDRVRAICYETGYMGESAARFYGDRESFADMFSGYYTAHEPENAWVIERKPDAEVVGYLLGCVDSRRAWDPAVVGAKHAVLRGLLFRPGTAGFLFRLVWDLIRDFGVNRPKVDLERYPAHLHVDVLPEARGGFGIAMVKRYVEHLRSLRVRGLHAEMISENTLAVAAAERIGFRKVGEPFLLPGIRGRDGSRLHGQLLVMDLAEPASLPSDANDERLLGAAQ